MNPPDIAGLQAWYKADALTGLSDGQGVSSWTDSSGNGNTLTQATGSLQPLFKTEQLNGLPSVRSDGTDDLLANASYSHASTSVTCFALYRDNETTNFNRSRVITFGTLRLWIDVDAATGPGWFDGTSTVVFGAQLPDFHYITWVLPSGGTGEIFRDGSSLGTNAFAASALSGLNVFSEASANGAHLDLCEIFFYDSALSTNDRQGLEAYLVHKWLTSPVGFVSTLPPSISRRNRVISY